ncbi:hypothetical protein LTR08_005176 [Meristemomyces frigidus]|nr:hypothetical protein LTR08_005176 [Meristemomyces frigidus]
MALDKITPNDPRIKHQYIDIDGHRWHYLDFHPPAPQKGTLILLHGWPDLSLAWRYQIPPLLALGLRCLALDCMGYGNTGLPTNPDDLTNFSFKKHADAVAAIAASINAPRVILGGHDWGGAVVYRAAQWYPHLISHVFSVATPFMAPTESYVSTEEVVGGGVPQFGYQLQLGSAGQEVEKAVQGEARLRRFLKGIYGGRVVGGGSFMVPEEGVDLGVIEGGEVGMTPLLDEEELTYYVAQFALSGLHGPCNWYRTRRVNWEEDRALPAENRAGLKQPTLFIQCLNDSILKPEMSEGMEAKIPNLTRGEVGAGHWALWQAPEAVNESLRGWFEGVVFGGRSKI